MEKSDMQLVEKAAEASGFSAVRWSDDEQGLLMFGVQDPWNPLTDDGDALRLAAHLKLSISHHHNNENPAVSVIVPREWHGKFLEFHCYHGNNVSAAIRRVITYAAANINTTSSWVG